MRVAPELQNLHSLVPYPGLAQLAVRELLHRDWNDGSVTQGGEGGEGSLYIVRDQLNNDIDIFREPQIPVRADRRNTDDARQGTDWPSVDQTERQQPIGTREIGIRGGQ